MKSYRFELILGTLLLTLFLLVSHWQAPGSKLTQAEINDYLVKLQQLPWPDDEKALMLSHIKAWSEADDGRPVYMLNLMRYFPTLRPLPGVEGFQGTPAEANAHYESGVIPILAHLGVYPVFASEMQGVLGGAQPSTNLITFAPELDNWSRVLVIRYPSRRAFLELLSDPVYMSYAPYKAASLLVALAPMKGDMVFPESRQGLGAVLLILFLLAAWWRALRRARPV